VLAVLASESQQTQQFITVLVVALAAVGVLLAILTVWYWRYTNPRRRLRRVFPEPQGHDLDLRNRYATADGANRDPVYAGPGSTGWGYDDRHANDPYASDRSTNYPYANDPNGNLQGSDPHGGQRRRLLEDDDRDPYQRGGTDPYARP
jgi:hypothetical protein